MSSDDGLIMLSKKCAYANFLTRLQLEEKGERLFLSFEICIKERKIIYIRMRNHRKKEATDCSEVSIVRSLCVNSTYMTTQHLS